MLRSYSRLCSPGSTRGTIWDAGMEPVSGACKTNSPPVALSFWPLFHVLEVKGGTKLCSPQPSTLVHYLKHVWDVTLKDFTWGGGNFGFWTLPAVPTGPCGAGERTQGSCMQSTYSVHWAPCVPFQRTCWCVQWTEARRLVPLIRQMPNHFPLEIRQW